MGGTTSYHFTSLEKALSVLFGEGIGVAQSRRVAGGDIHDAFCLTLTDQRRVFMKENRKKNVALFAAEAVGLSAIAQTGAIGTPRVFGTGTDGDKSFLLMEFVNNAKPVPDFWEDFSRQLADMHRADTAALVEGGRFGFLTGNYIGTRPQSNRAHEGWTAFFRDCRLEPQFHRAERFFDREDRRRIGTLLEKVDDILVEPARPSLLHGDLWSGNFLTGDDGRAWLIDPAVYVGHAEADIAMTELFGGFSGRFYEAYKETGLLQPGYGGRRDLYNLYHLLNHLNMFGLSYLSSVRRIIRKYV